MLNAGISGFSNTAVGGNAINGVVSGLLNTGVPQDFAFRGLNVSGFTSGIGNTGTGTFGWLNIVSTLQAVL